MAKTKSDLEKSRNERAKIIGKYGFVPESIWEIKYSKNIRLDQFTTSQNQKAMEFHKKQEYYQDKELLKAFSSSSKSVRGESGGLSIFPYHLGENIVKFYSEIGETIMDPFMGHNSRMQICFELGRNYVGFDISKKFMEANFKIKEKLIKNFMGEKPPKIDITEMDSREINLPEASVDMIFTSPPYWDLEYYGDEFGQLGKGNSYELFLDRLKKVLVISAKILKHKRFMVINVNDFRKDGKFYSYHSDVIKILENSYVKLWDTIIVDWKNSIGSCFATQIEDRKITAKRHEYLLVFKRIGGG